MSYDPTPEPEVTIENSAKTKAADALVAPLTRNEREDMNALSTEAYGKRLEWQKLLRKGELRPGRIVPNSGKGFLDIKRLHHFTVNEVKLKMEKILTDCAEAREAAQRAKAEAGAKKENDTTE